ncbi:MAG: hypothetical protein LC135_14085 [Phycisphaerae bacterium]|nr:hypothetical protein [Phycisphaerae bacterium]MCZ2400980.1 hypothetical protein [Phycisphaerae bacterium]NUQ48617.1 hypothetical protein [Phycisphaerae bacterium]
MVPQRTVSPQTRQRARLLIVSPDALTEWSVRSYLRPWFDVRVAHSVTQALRILEAERFDALVLAEDLTERAGARLERKARARNAGVLIVHMVISDGEIHPERTAGCWIEKPFQLSQLALALGVPAAEVLTDS